MSMLMLSLPLPVCLLLLLLLLRLLQFLLLTEAEAFFQFGFDMVQRVACFAAFDEDLLFIHKGDASFAFKNAVSSLPHAAFEFAIVL